MLAGNASPTGRSGPRIALEVADAMQGKGLGTALLCQLAEAANQTGIQVFDAEVLPENHRMLRVICDCGFPVKVHSLPGVLLVELRTCLAANAPKVRRTRRHNSSLPVSRRVGW